MLVLLDVVEMLHCHRSLGVGVYDVAMLLAELETKMTTKSIREFGLYAFGRGT